MREMDMSRKSDIGCQDLDAPAAILHDQNKEEHLLTYTDDISKKMIYIFSQQN